MDFEQWLGTLDKSQLMTVSSFLATHNCTPFEDDVLIHLLSDVLEGVETFQFTFRHYPLQGMGAKVFAVACKGKTSKQAMENYIRNFDKTKYRKVEIV